MNFTVTIDEKITQKHLEKEGIQVGCYASDLLEKLEWKEKGEFNLVIKTVAELGLKNGGTLSEIYAKAKEQGLDLCPAEVGPHLRLQYVDQPLNEWVYIAMEPIADRDGRPGVFRLECHYDGPWLHGDWALPDDHWNDGDRFVFALRKCSSETVTPTDPCVTLILDSDFKKGDRVKIVGDKVVKVKVCKECNRPL